MKLEPIFRRALARGIYVAVASFLILFATATKFDLEPFVALTIGVAVMGYDWFSFERERKRKDGRAHALLVAAIAVPVLLVSGAVRHCGGAIAGVSAARRTEPMPCYEAALVRLRERLNG